VYERNYVSLCLIDTEGNEYEDIEEDYQTPVTELRPVE
jgi:hypothetical protein